MAWGDRALGLLPGATVPRSEYDLAIGALRFANERVRQLTDRLETANLRIAQLNLAIEQRDGLIINQEAQIINLLSG